MKANCFGKVLFLSGLLFAVFVLFAENAVFA